MYLHTKRLNKHWIICFLKQTEKISVGDFKIVIPFDLRLMRVKYKIRGKLYAQIFIEIL